MDEKTEELRDIFVDLADDDTVTEKQNESRGSLAESGSAERLGEVVAEMRDRYAFDTDLDDETLVTLVELFYREASDGDIADELDTSRREVFRARLELHLVRESDTDAPFDFSQFRELLAEDHAVADVADRLDVSASTVRRYRRVVRAQNEARRVSDRFRSEFEDALVEAGLRDAHTTEMRDDGLEEATDGMETDVSF